MAQLFDRKVTVLVRDPAVPNQVLEISGLRVQFKVRKTLEKSPNCAEIVVTNLAHRSRALLQAKGVIVQLFAGYANRLEQIYAGDARTVNHLHQRPEWLSKIDCGDGERAMQWQRINESFAPATKVARVLTTVAKKLGVDTSSAEAAFAEVQDEFVNGYTATGRVAAILDELLLGRGYEWSIQDGRLQVLKVGKANTDTVTVLTSDTGMIGSPEFAAPEKKGKAPVLKVKTLLQGHIRPGSRIRVESKQISGDFRAQSVAHEGDTAGDAFYTEVEAVAYQP